MPPDFGFPGAQEIWVPLSHADATTPRGQSRVPSLDVVGRLHDGITPGAAAAELSSIATRLSETFPDTNKHYRAVEVKPLMTDFIPDDIAGMLWTMLFGAFLVLGVACANVANLLLAQASRRTKELAVRSALGASRGRLVVQMLTEGLALSAFGAIAGLGLANVGIGLIWSAVEKVNPPYWMKFTLNPTVLGLVVLATLLTSLLSGLVPALQASRVDTNSMLKDDARTASSLHLGRFARFLVVAQIALSCGLLAAALLLVKVGFDQRHLDLPYEPSSIYSARMALFDSDYPGEAERAQFYRNLARSIAEDPQVESVAYSGNYRFFGGDHHAIAIEGVAYVDDDDRPRVRHELIGGDYFSLLRTHLLDGRDFGPADFELDAPAVTIVNAVFARRFFPTESPVGRRFSVREDGETKWLTIVGVAPDLHMQGTDTSPDDGSGYYTPYTSEAPRFMTVLLRPRGGDPTALAAVLRRHLEPLDPNLPIYESVTLDKNLEEQLRGIDIFANIFAGLGLAALFLASIGVYGVMAFSVNQRQQEIGIRMALGAGGRTIMGMILRQGGRQVALGLAFGLALAFGLGQLIASFMEGIPANDLRLYAAVALVLCGVGFLAVIGPAWRASAFSPLRALRAE